MSIFSLAILWNWEFDQDFVEGIEQECSARGISTYRIDPNNLHETLNYVRSGDLEFRALYDRASDGDPEFLPLVQILQESATYLINPHFRIVHAVDKATMHLELLSHGINVPNTIILPPYNEEPTVQMDTKDLSHLGAPFVIKPANTTGGGTGVVLDARSMSDIREKRQDHKNDKYLIQETIIPIYLDGKRGWFRVYYAFGEIIPCWWDDKTHMYSELSSDEEEMFHLDELRQVMTTIHDICGLDFFSSEIAVTNDRKFIVVDYVNEVCDMRLQSRYANGAPDGVVHRVEWLLAEAVSLRLDRMSD